LSSSTDSSEKGPTPLGDLRTGAEGARPAPSAVKAAIRRRVLAARDALDRDTRIRLSAAIFAKIADLDAFRRAATVAAYSSFGSEPVTAPFLETVLALDKALVLPRIRRETRRLDLHRVRDLDSELEPGVWGIREPNPATCPPVPLRAIDFLLVPGVAFDIRGGRMGYGGGYYDRLMAECDHGPALIAAAFEVQIVAEVPMGPGDRRVDRVITERCAYPA